MMNDCTVKINELQSLLISSPLNSHQFKPIIIYARNYSKVALMKHSLRAKLILRYSSSL